MLYDANDASMMSYQQGGVIRNLARARDLIYPFAASRLSIPIIIDQCADRS